MRNPVSQLRLDWIMLNVIKDNQDEAENRKLEIEYGGFFANPDVYFQVKAQEKRHKVFKPFRVEYDTSDFDRRLNLAIAGTPDIREQDTELAERVKRKRIEIQQAVGAADPRIVKPLTDADYEGDEIEVEYSEPGDDGGAT
jgi:hypothetical protein